jgi:hypothetical protein
MGHNFYTANATVSVESSDTGVWGGEETVRLSGFTVTSNKAVFKIFTTASATYWRVKIVTASIVAKLAICLLGERLDFPRYLSGNYDPAPEGINAILARSKAGHMIGATLKNISISIKADFKWLLPLFIDNTFRPAWDAHLSLCKPFAWVWDRTNHATDVYFVVIPEGFTLSTPYDPYRRSLSLTMEGIKE